VRTGSSQKLGTLKAENGGDRRWEWLETPGQKYRCSYTESQSPRALRNPGVLPYILRGTEHTKDLPKNPSLCSLYTNFLSLIETLEGYFSHGLSPIPAPNPPASENWAVSMGY
jgi:hypothetical protein